jgi:hypothetical protein
MTTKVACHYYQSDFEKIIHDGINTAIPMDVLQKIMELEAKMKVKSAAISHHYESRQTGFKKRDTNVTHVHKKVNVVTKEEDWSRNQPSVLRRPIVDTESKEAIVQKLLVSLNKISKTNFDTQWNDIQEALQGLHKDDDIREALVEMFSVCTRTQSMTPLYSSLWSKLSELELYNRLCEELLYEKWGGETFSDIVYVDPEKNNDAFCLYTKKNAQRRAFTSFLVCLWKESRISSERMMEWILALLEKVELWVENKIENRRNELEEVSENLFLCLTSGQSFDGTLGQNIREVVQRLSQTVTKEKPNMTSRAKFKYQDVVALWKKAGGK